jgi:hypothetical protein
VAWSGIVHPVGTGGSSRLFKTEPRMHVAGVTGTEGRTVGTDLPLNIFRSQSQGITTISLTHVSWALCVCMQYVADLIVRSADHRVINAAPKVQSGCE